MNNKDKKQQVLVETEYELKTGNHGAGKLEAPCREYLKAKEEMAPLNKEVKNLQGQKKVVEAYIIKELAPGTTYEIDGYAFTHTGAKIEKKVVNTLDEKALIEYIKENNPDIIEHFSKERIVDKEVSAKLSVKKVGK